MPSMAAMSGAAASAANHKGEKQPVGSDPYHPSVLRPHDVSLLAQEPFVILFAQHMPLFRQVEVQCIQLN